MMPQDQHRETLLRRAFRRAFRLAGWLLLAAAAAAVWPVTAVTGPGCAVAWLRCWPAARLGRQAGWALPMSAVWIAAESARGWRALTLNPARDGASGWPHLTVATVARTFLLVAPVTIPAGLALAALLWAWRAAVTTGTGGGLASAPITRAGAGHGAVSRRVPLSSLYERVRSLGLGAQVSTQSWQGLGRDEDERRRVAATADGGLWVLPAPPPEPLAVLAGNRRVLATASAYAARHAGGGGSEAFAGLGGDSRGADATAPLPAARDAAQAAGAGEGPVRMSWLVRQLPARIWRGRPLRLLARALAACLLALAVLHLVPGQPATPALVTGLVTGFLLTARSDLAPPLPPP